MDAVSHPSQVRFSRRRFLRVGLGAAGVLTLGVRSACAEADVVPFSVQAELLAKVAGYERNFASRAGDRAIVLLPSKASDPSTVRAAHQFASALGGVARIGPVAHEEVEFEYASAASLADLCRARRAAIVYFGPGFGANIPAIAAALTGVSVLSVTATAEDVPSGVVLGFGLEGGKPKLLLNLAQARRQDVAFRPDLVRLSTVVG